MKVSFDLTLQIWLCNTRHYITLNCKRHSCLSNTHKIKRTAEGYLLAIVLLQQTLDSNKTQRITIAGARHPAVKVLLGPCVWVLLLSTQLPYLAANSHKHLMQRKADVCGSAEIHSLRLGVSCSERQMESSPQNRTVISSSSFLQGWKLETQFVFTTHTYGK